MSSKTSGRRLRKPVLIAGFLAPALILYATFVLGPYLQAGYISLTDWRGFSPRMSFVGLANYTNLLQDQLFWTGLRHNLVLLLTVPVLTLLLGLFFASMLNVYRIGRGVAGSQFYRSIYFFPQILPIAVTAILWQFVYTPRSGLLNTILGTDHAWLGDPRTALGAVIAVMVWGGVGFYVVLFSAGMQAISREIYEAAELDGASPLMTFRHITLPLLRRTIQVGLVYLTIGALDGFALIQIMTVGPGGPDNSTEVIALTLYRRAFTDGSFGYASAMGVVLLVLTLALALITNRITRRHD